jgi:hypothetical protein
MTQQSKVVEVRGAEAVAMAVVIAGGTAAFAAPVRFENTGPFDWRPAACGTQVWLDITKPADQQTPDVPSDTSLSQWYYYGTCNDPQKDGNYFYCGYTSLNTAFVQDAGNYNGLDPLAAGSTIGPGSAWGDRSSFSVYRSPCCEINDWGAVGTVAYVGARIEIAGQIHYGWVKARLTDPRGAQLEALAWGYETEPNTPVAAGAGACNADYNNDSSVDFFDYLDFVADFDSENPNADFNGDATVDFFDYLDFVAAFDACG